MWPHLHAEQDSQEFKRLTHMLSIVEELLRAWGYAGLPTRQIPPSYHYMGLLALSRYLSAGCARAPFRARRTGWLYKLR